MKLILTKLSVLSLLVLPFFTGCSDNEDSPNGTGNGSTQGALVIDGENCHTQAADFTGTDIISASTDDVQEEIHSTTFVIDAFRDGENATSYYVIRLICDRINFDEIQVGDELPVTEAIIYLYRTGLYDDDNIYGYEGYAPTEGNITFEGLTDNKTLVHLSFNNVTVRVRGKSSGKEETHTINGQASFRRNQIMVSPDFPSANLTDNETPLTDVELNGTWYVRRNSKDENIITTLDIPSVGLYRLQIEMADINGLDLNSYIGTNLADLSITNFNFNYQSGEISIIEFDKPEFLFQYPDITFRFNDFTIRHNGQNHTINGTAKVVYDYASR